MAQIVKKLPPDVIQDGLAPMMRKEKEGGDPLKEERDPLKKTYQWKTFVLLLGMAICIIGFSLTFPPARETTYAARDGGWKDYLPILGDCFFLTGVLLDDVNSAASAREKPQWNACVPTIGALTAIVGLSILALFPLAKELALSEPVKTIREETRCDQFLMVFGAAISIVGLLIIAAYPTARFYAARNRQRNFLLMLGDACAILGLVLLTLRPHPPPHQPLAAECEVDYGAFVSNCAGGASGPLLCTLRRENLPAIM
ncbi:MAG: hypothetical protein AB2556_19740, partial [Candidatus Thiodiazotropha sp.]